MITKWIQFTVDPAQAERFHEALAQLELASKAEKGCLHYAAFQGADAPDTFTVLESWDSADTFEAHRVAPHVDAFKKNCGEMILQKSGQSLKPVASS